MGLRLRGRVRTGGRFCRGGGVDGDGGSGGVCGQIWRGRLLSAVEWRDWKG